MSNASPTQRKTSLYHSHSPSEMSKEHQKWNIPSLQKAKIEIRISNALQKKKKEGPKEIKLARHCTGNSMSNRDRVNQRFNLARVFCIKPYDLYIYILLFPSHLWQCYTPITQVTWFLRVTWLHKCM